MAPLRRAANVALAALLAACGDPGTIGMDATTGDASAEPFSVQPPVAPAAPVFDPCPAGWGPIGPADLTPACAPWVSGEEACGATEARFPGEAGCTPVGPPCPAGVFAEDLPTDAPVIYVQPGAGAGDGSAALPFERIAEAVGLASAGTVIALSKGRWDELVRLRGGVELRGACVAETIVTDSIADRTAGVINPRGAGVVVRDLTVADSPRAGVAANGAGIDVHLQDVWIRGVTITGVVAVVGGSITASNLVVRDSLGDGVEAFAGGHVEITRAEIAGCVGLGVLVGEPDTSVRLEAVRALGSGEPGLHVQNGASATVVASIFEGSGATGISAFGGAALEIEDVVVRDGRGAPDGTGGGALHVDDRSTARVTRFLAEGNRSAGLAVSTTAEAELEDIVVRETGPRTGDDGGGRGLSVESGATAVVRRAVFERNREIGVFVLDAGTTADIEDLRVVETEGLASDGAGGVGIHLKSGAALALRRAVLERNRLVGIHVLDAETSLSMEDVRIAETREQTSDRGFGRGLNVQGGTVELARVALEDNRESGLYAAGPGSIVLATDLAVRDTMGRIFDGHSGSAAQVADGARLQVDGGVFERNRFIAVMSWGAGTTATLRRTRTDDTLESDCSAASCNGFEAGTALAAGGGGALTVEGFSVARAALCGVMVSAGGSVDLLDGDVGGCSIGACVQEPAYDLDRLTQAVRFRDNGTNLDATSLPVPEPGGAVDIL